MNIFRYEKYSHTATLLFRYFISCVLDEDDVSSFLVSTFIFNSYSINFFYSHKNVLGNQRSQVVDVIFSIHLLHILCNVIDLCKCILSLEGSFLAVSVYSLWSFLQCCGNVYSKFQGSKSVWCSVLLLV